MQEIKLTDRISYIPACETPISSDVGIIRGDEMTYIFDTGSIPGTLEFLQSLDGKCDIIISHFHLDHTWWLTPHRKGGLGVKKDDTLSLNYERPKFRNLYIGSYTRRFIPDGTVVTEPVVIEDGVRLTIMPLPSSHSRGGLMLMVDEEYLFLGDATYCQDKKGENLYNVQLLKEEMEALAAVPAHTCLLSHDKRFVRDKRVVLRQLNSIYSHRRQGEPYITVD